jgi:hypothetical protein
MATNQSLQARAIRQTVEREIHTILTNPDICINELRVQANNNQNRFRFNSLLRINQLVDRANSIRIRGLNVENRVNIAGNTWEADLVVDLDYGNSIATFLKDNDPRVRVRYTLQNNGNGRVSDCGLAMSTEEACTHLGLTWNTNTNNCEICASLGGTEVNGRCAL